MAEISLEQALQQIVDQAKEVSTELPIKDKAKITKAGAKVFKRELEQTYHNKHYRNRKTGENPHLADTVLMQNTNIDGRRTGNSTVGWGKDKAYIANFLENGTRYPLYTSKGHAHKNGGEVAINGDKTIDKLRHDPRVRQMIAEAEAKEYRKIVNKK